MVLEDILIAVQKPGRYVGGEWNAVKKEWSSGMVKFLLAFPDVYEVGMSCLGVKIIYGILNERSDCVCERVFSPWTDMEKKLRENNMPLFSLETRRPLKEFDIVGISLAYELSYSNVLGLLDLGGIPKMSCERGDSDPIVIAGGPSCCNPEPLADFIDAFLIGEGEDAINEIIDSYKRSTADAARNRKNILRDMAKIPGVYVPSFYEVEYGVDNTIAAVRSIDDCPGQKIKKRTVADLDGAYYPTRQIVPNIQIVHDRIAIEIMRGCKHACRFCQASAIYRPCRERTTETILKLARESYEMTGHDEISLLSLSSVDHSRIKETIEALNIEFKDKSVAISVPSLRIEDALEDLPALIAKVKKPGLTFAPEVGSERMRGVIRKDIDIEKLFKAVSGSFKLGWKGIKLYFMIGLPGEKEEDILAIAELAEKVSGLRRQHDGRPARVTLSVNAFIPKPHTALQWEPMDSLDSLNAKIDLLRVSTRSRAVELDFHPLKMSFLEAAFSRGDRRLGRVIYEAWKAGARFDGWKEMFDFDRWMDAFKLSGLDPVYFAARKREFSENLPWDFIETGIIKKTLEKDALSMPCGSV